MNGIIWDSEWIIMSRRLTFEKPEHEYKYLARISDNFFMNIDNEYIKINSKILILYRIIDIWNRLTTQSLLYRYGISITY